MGRAFSAPHARAEWPVRLSAAHLADQAKVRALLEALPPEQLARGSDADWAAASGASLSAAARWRAAALSFDWEGELRRLEALDGRLLLLGEPGYPALLAGVADAPCALYARGPLDSVPAAAVVGTRSPTPYGRRMSRRIASELARSGVAVVSGLARGIDAEAHQAALDERGRTWAVLPGGLGAVYPPDNRGLAERILAGGGALVSERPCRESPGPGPAFLARNRLISGLAWAGVVVEGELDSGAMNTAAHALEQGRELLAVPGPADSPMSAGPHRLLRDGARLCLDGRDLIAALPAGSALKPAGPTGKVLRAPLEPDEAKVLNALGADSLSLDELVRATGLDTTRLSLIMFGLEVKDIVFSSPGSRYAQKVVQNRENPDGKGR